MQWLFFKEFPASSCCSSRQTSLEPERQQLDTNFSRGPVFLLGRRNGCRKNSGLGGVRRRSRFSCLSDETVCNFWCVVKKRRPLVFLTELRNFSRPGRGGLLPPCSISARFVISRVLIQTQEVGSEEEAEKRAELFYKIISDRNIYGHWCVCVYMCVQREH